MRLKKHTWILLLLLQQPLFSQDFYIKNLTTDHGLPSNQVYHVMQSRTGALWFCTDNGVSVFDGKSFINYTTEDGMTDNVVFSSMEDREGRIWFRPMNGHVFYYHKNKFHQLTVYPILDKILLNSRLLLSNITYDEQGNIMFTQERGYVYRILAAEDFNRLDSILVVPQKNTVSVLQYPGGLICAASDPIKQIDSFYIGKRGIGFYAAEPVDFSFNPSIIQDSLSGKIYFSLTNHLMVMDPSTGKMQQYRMDVHSMKLWPGGDLWVSTDHGIKVYECGDALKYKTTFFKDQSVSFISIDYEKNIWVSTLEQGIFMLPAAYNADFFTGNQIDFLIVSLLDDSTIVTGRRDKHLYRVNVFSGESTVLANLDEDLSSVFFLNNMIQLSTHSVHMIDPHSPRKMQKWDKSYARDMVFRNGKYYTINHLNLGVWDQKSRIKKHSVFNGRGLCLLFYKDQLLAGSTSGVFVFNEQNRTIPFHGLDFRVDKMSIGPGNRLYLLNRSRGIFLLDEQHSRVDTLFTVEQLWSDRINDMEIKGKYLYISAKTGAYRYDFRSKKLQMLNQSSGLMMNDVKHVFMMKDRLLVCFERFFQLMDTSIFSIGTAPPRFVLRHTFVNGKKQNLLHELGTRENNIIMEFSLYAFNRNKYTRLQACITGSNDFIPHRSWFDLENEKLLMMNLDPGNYIVQVRAIDNRNQPGKPVFFGNFEIARPCWQRTIYLVLFILVFVLLLLASGYYIIRYTKSRTLRQAALHRMIDEYKFKVLRTQINPHFIFNSLNSIQSNIIKGEKELSYNYLNNFSKFFRRVLQCADREFIPVWEEAELLGMYLAIESGRFRHSFIYQVNVQPGARDLYLPALLLQPLVENSVRHGVSTCKRGEGRIMVNINVEDQQLVLEVLDNGHNFSPEGFNEEKAQKSDSMGISITYGRIKLMSEKYGDSGISADRVSIEGEIYTRVRVTIKAIEKV